MNCDGCKKEIEEDDTYEKILCKCCLNEANNVRCNLCHCKIEVSNALKYIRNKIGSVLNPIIERRIILASALLLTLIAISFYSPILGAKLALGFAAVPIVTILVILILILMGPGIYKIGDIVNTFLDFGIEDWDDGEPKKWLLGAITIASPFIAWRLGSLILHLIKL